MYDNLKLYEAIFKRKSVRKYKDDKISKDIIEKVQFICDNIKGIYDNIEFKTYIVDDTDMVEKMYGGIIGKYGKIKAPQYIVVTSEEKEGYLENLGYIFEKVILNLTEMGLGTCWIGTPFKKKVLNEIIKIQENHKPVFLIAFGYCEDSDKLYRKNISEFKRKDMNELVEGKIQRGWKAIFEAARIAPSATNSQPWRFVVDNNYVHIYCIKRTNIISKKIYDNLNRIDMGIVLSHLDIAMQNFQCKKEFKQLQGYDKRGCRYLASIEK
ncbi:nitroreductase family protein [Clostridium ganghwense]|uniref:Nitroreductase family protein n=1 Tax=Clostridium ganghwense TaxID=312089 RepID=A0ABT4CK11_9CLOT|nr:nitroreductase family protein [Clostridium ganghwense]MCY6369395.1 nitroreductase family protein [Clostridium ganghwense]